MYHLQVSLPDKGESSVAIDHTDVERLSPDARLELVLFVRGIADDGSFDGAERLAVDYADPESALGALELHAKKRAEKRDMLRQEHDTLEQLSVGLAEVISGYREIQSRVHDDEFDHGIWALTEIQTGFDALRKRF
jgi:hypothetical protein